MHDASVSGSTVPGSAAGMRGVWFLCPLRLATTQPFRMVASACCSCRRGSEVCFPGATTRAASAGGTATGSSPAGDSGHCSGWGCCKCPCFRGPGDVTTFPAARGIADAIYRFHGCWGAGEPSVMVPFRQHMPAEVDRGPCRPVAGLVSAQLQSASICSFLMYNRLRQRNSAGCGQVSVMTSYVVTFAYPAECALYALPMRHICSMLLELVCGPAPASTYARDCVIGKRTAH